MDIKKEVAWSLGEVEGYGETFAHSCASVEEQSHMGATLNAVCEDERAIWWVGPYLVVVPRQLFHRQSCLDQHHLYSWAQKDVLLL